MHVTKQWDCTPIRQTFLPNYLSNQFRQTNIIAAKHSRYMVKANRYYDKISDYHSRYYTYGKSNSILLHH